MISEAKIPRRGVLAGLACWAGLAAGIGPAQALTTSESKALIDKLVGEINAIINSGKSEESMYRDFEGIFRKYAYVEGIARTVLGAPARTASKAELRAFSDAFTGYMARKYGKRFREFIGGWVEVESAQKVKSYFEVHTMAKLAGQAPFAVTFRVSDRSGSELFFDMLIEGISLIKAERNEIGTMLDQAGGDIDKMVTRLKTVG